MDVAHRGRRRHCRWKAGTTTKRQPGSCGESAAAPLTTSCAAASSATGPTSRASSLATGRVPPKIVEHTKTMVVIDNPLTGIKNIVGNAPQRLAGTNLANLAARGGGRDRKLQRSRGAAAQGALQVHRAHPDAAAAGRQHVRITRRQAEVCARRRQPHDGAAAAVRDEADEFCTCATRSARTMKSWDSLFDNGVIPQVDQIVDVADDRSRFSGPLWVLSRTFNKKPKRWLYDNARNDPSKLPSRFSVGAISTSAESIRMGNSKPTHSHVFHRNFSPTIVQLIKRYV